LSHRSKDIHLAPIRHLMQLLLPGSKKTSYLQLHINSRGRSRRYLSKF